MRLYTTDNNDNNYYNNNSNNNNIDNNNNTNTDNNDNLIKFPLTLRSSNIQLFECCHHRNSPPFYLFYFI